MFKRTLEAELLAAAAEYPVVTLLGPRQAGKTTLARAARPALPYASLEDPDVRAEALADPRGFLGRYRNGAILDEIQRAPALLSYLQGVVDADPRPGRFVLTGSHQPEVHQAVTQTLAGRTAVLELMPLSVAELHAAGRGPDSVFTLLASGSYPAVHERQLDPQRFFRGYVATYVERDVRALLNLKDLGRFQQFLRLLAGRIGQLVNYSSLATDIGVSSTTIKNWVSVLRASFLAYELRPYHANIRKRFVKSPKIYFTDTGLAAYLLGIHTPEQVERDPLRGVLYENFAIMEAVKTRLNRGAAGDLWFFRDAVGHEVDLLIPEGRRLHPVEIKSGATFTPEFADGIAYFREHGGHPNCGPGMVVYNGERQFVFKDVRVVNPLRTPAWASGVSER